MTDSKPSTQSDSNQSAFQLWTRNHPWASDEKAKPIIESLKHAPVADSQEHLRAIALETDHEKWHVAAMAALRLAEGAWNLKLPSPEIYDICGKWTWLAVRNGSVAGALLLVRALIALAESGRPEGEDENDGSYTELLSMASRVFSDTLTDRLYPNTIADFPERLEAELRWRPRPDGPARVVIERWTIDRHDDRLNKYRILSEPVPLAGGDRDIDAFVRQLEAEFPWMAQVTERIADDFALCSLAAEPWLHFRPLLLVGPPGTGKSRFARRLAELIRTGYRVIGAGSSSDDRDLTGTSHGWSNREPGAIPRLMVTCGTANPVVLIDELDKSGGSEKNGDIRQTLLAMLEPETAKSWFDECLQASCDLSAVSWIATANSLEPISAPLRSRFSIARIGLPGPESITAILDGMRRDIAEELCLDQAVLPELDPLARRHLTEAIGHGRSLREIRSALRRALAATARQSWNRS